jgi:hypothetical protein
MIHHTKKKSTRQVKQTYRGEIIKEEQKHCKQREIVKFSVSGSAKQAAYFFLAGETQNLSL